MRVYCIKAALMYNKRTYRNIEILENQTLDELHSAIFEAFDRYDPHLYSFFLTRKAERSLRKIYEATEITHPMSVENLMGFFGSEKKYDAEETKIGDLDLDVKDKLYYLFDFGDDWWHELTVLNIRDEKNSGGFPKIVKIAGKSPPQYPDYEDEEYDEVEEDEDDEF